MKMYEVFDHFQDHANDRSWWPLPQNDIESPPLLTAAVRLSGRMDDCKTEADLKGALDRCMGLVNAGVLTTWSWAQEGELIKLEMEKWARAANAQLQADAERN